MRNRVFALLSVTSWLAGCATFTTTPPTASPFPLPQHEAARLPWTISIQTMLGSGNRPCEHLGGELIRRLREQRVFREVQAFWLATAPSDVVLRCTFDCQFDEHPTRTLYLTLLMGGTCFLASPLPLYDWDYTLAATVEVVQHGEVLTTYYVTSAYDADFNHWATGRPQQAAAFLALGETDVLARLITALVQDHTFWSALAQH